MTEESTIAALEFVPIPDAPTPLAPVVPSVGNSKHSREMVAEVGERRAAGMSYKQIALDLGVTRCVIAGIVKRNGFKPNATLARPKPARPPTPKISHGRDSTARYHPKPPLLPPADYAELAAPTVVSAKPVGIVGLEPSHCRYPVSGEGEHTKFCGNERHGDLPYCLGHCRVAYRRPGELR